MENTDDPLTMDHDTAIELLRKIKQGGMTQEEIIELEDNGDINMLLEHVGGCDICTQWAKSNGLIVKPPVST